jgi:hypothetical protein
VCVAVSAAQLTHGEVRSLDVLLGAFTWHACPALGSTCPAAVLAPGLFS